jgi:hypothetical protein
MPRQVISPYDGSVWAEAPDETWMLRDDPFPPIGVLVEIVHASRNKTPTVYKYSLGKVVEYHTEGTQKMSTWWTRYDQILVFNPDFWRPIKDVDPDQ